MNLAHFYGCYDDLQVSAYDGGIGFLIRNAASSISKGINDELIWQVTEQFRLHSAFECLDFRYDEFVNRNCGTTERLNTGAVLCDWSGDQAPVVPRFEGVLALEHAFAVHADWSLRQHITWQHKSSHSTASDNEIQTRQAGYGLLGYRAELRSASHAWSLALTGKNLTNCEYNILTSVILLAPGGAFASLRPRGRELSLEFAYRFSWRALAREKSWTGREEKQLKGKRGEISKRMRPWIGKNVGQQMR